MSAKKFNLFDLLIIIALAGVIIGVAFRAQIKDALFSGDRVQIKAVLEVESMSNDAAALIDEGVNLYVFKSGNLFGEVISAEYTPVFETVFVGDREIEATSEFYSSAVIVISIDGYIKDGTFYTKNNDMLLVKSVFSLITDETFFTCKIKSLEPMKNP